MLMFSSEFMENITAELAKANNSVQIISAFCKKEAIKFFDQGINNSVAEKTLLVRFSLSDIISGASDLDIYEYCKTNNWKLYVRFDLHAKTYIFDKLRCIIGSANLTSRGIGLSNNHNLEISTLLELSDEDKSKVEELILHSVLMTDTLYLKMKKEIEKLPNKLIGAENWSEEVMSLLKPNYHTLFTYDLPNCERPSNLKEDSLEFLDIDNGSSLEEIKQAFKRSRIFLWLCDNLRAGNNELYFGALTERLHNSLINDPVPYRKEVKELLSNLLGWVSELDINEVKVDRPNYSQRIKLKI